MFAIGMEIEEVVENIESGGAEAVEREASERADNGLDRKVVGQGKGQEEQKIFRPVVAAESVDPCAERLAERCPRFENRAFERGYGGGLFGTGLRADHVSCAGIAPDFYIGGGCQRDAAAGGLFLS